ncbi:MAG: hypothetical protein U0996_12415 [Planctomycetaceae bacterium]
MKVEDCIVVVERRSLGGCIDLAFVFAREFAGPLFRLWALCAIPSCLTILLFASLSTDLLIISVLVFMFFSAVFNALLVSSMGPQVFGVPISLSQAAKSWRKRLISWFFLTAFSRLAQCIGFVFVTAYVGHLPEVLLLEQSKVNGVTSRLSWLCGGGGFGRNLGRVIGLSAFWAGMTVGLFLLIDFLSTTLLNYPILASRRGATSVDQSTLMAQLFLDDARVHVVLQLALWLPYPMIRLAWFFCYLDQRIRNECWDLQVQFRAEAARLEQLA